MVDLPPDVTSALVKGGLDAARAAADTPTGKSIGSNLGDVAVVASRWVRNLMLPLALHNAKREAYFTDRFESDLAAKVQHIPAEHLQQPKASLVGPALEGLGNAYDEDELREQYLNLLAASMDDRRAAGLHPAFGEILKQLTADEVGLLNATLPQHSLAIARLRRHEAGTRAGVTVRNHLLAVHDNDPATPWVHPDIPSWIDNWVRLGLIDVDYTRQLATDSAYDWVEERPEFLTVDAEINKLTHDLSFDKGLLTVTDFGQRFAAAVAPAQQPSQET